MLEINVDSNCVTPLYQQIAEQIKKLVEEKQLKSGEQIPSVRDLAKLLQLNPSTVARAYYDLKLEAVVTTSRRRGTIINGKNTNYQKTAIPKASLSGSTRGGLLDTLTENSVFQEIETVLTLHPARWRVQRSV